MMIVIFGIEEDDIDVVKKKNAKDVRTDTVIVVKEDNLEMKEKGSGTMICPALI